MAPSNPFHPSTRQAEATQPHSPARLAGEAFFSQRPLASELASSEVVIVRRESRIPSPEEASVQAPEGAVDAARGPTVHRLPAGTLELAPEPAAAPSAPQQVTTPAAAIPARKKRRQLHGEVTIIRSAGAPQVSQLSVLPSMAATSEPVSSDARSAANAPRPHAPALLAYQPRYPKLLAQLRSLEAAAQQAKRREALEAIRWIKRAIRAHGLNPQDLGLH